jgi:HEAT repeat protein
MIVPSALLNLSLLLAGDADGRAPDARVSAPTPEAERLLRIAEDPRQPSKARVEAVDALGRRREDATVPRLVELLPGSGDVVTFRVVIALGQIGDPRALPALRRMRDDPPFRLHGKINAAVDGTIRALERR